MKTVHFTLLYFVLLAFLSSCKTDETPTPNNPFQNQQTNKDTSKTNIDPTSLVGIHQNILTVKCNTPNCHDGTFEPDYRTPQSTFSTLVYQKVKKNTPDSAFTYRVVPFDTAKSWLHERIYTSGPDYMPSQGARLSRTEIKQINAWILKGAPDINGNIATEPDFLPNFYYYVAFNQAGGRIDTIRTSFDKPFIMPKNQTVKFWFLFNDDKTPVENYTINTLKISTDKENFTTGTQNYSATYKLYGTYKIWELVFSNTSFQAGKTYYMRYYVSDGKHGNQFTEFPNKESAFYYKGYMSFTVQ